MVLALVCSEADLENELSHTALWRSGVERHSATRLEEAQVMALAAKPDVVLVDRDLPRAERLVAALRADASTRRASIAVLARGDFDPSEVTLLEAGANAILRLPPGPDWDERLVRLMQVPLRRNARFPVSFKVTAVLAAEPEPVLGTALNLSLSGILLETASAPLETGDDLDLALLLPDGDDLIRAAGRVVRLAGPARFGVQFIDLDGAALERIAAFVEAAEA